MDQATTVLAGAGITAIIFAIWKRASSKPSSSSSPSKPEPPSPDDDHDDEPDGPMDTNPPKPMKVGTKEQVQPLLNEMDALFRTFGVDTSKLSAAEVTVMPKTPLRSHAIPPREYWPRMAKTLKEVAMPLRQQMGFPFYVTGYRPSDYNKSVGGAPGSRHQWFEAVDIRPAGSHNTLENRKRIALAAAQIYATRGATLRMGFGVYGSFNSPSNIHVDTGWQQRTWKAAREYVDLVRSNS